MTESEGPLSVSGPLSQSPCHPLRVCILQLSLPCQGLNADSPEEGVRRSGHSQRAEGSIVESSLLRMSLVVATQHVTVVCLKSRV